jgi:phosphoglycolate phosphatase
MREKRHTIPSFPGAAELLVDLARAGVQVGIVSSNARDNVAAILGAPATSAVRFFACGMSMFGKRPHLRKVLKQSGVPRERALYIADQPTDLEAARAEGIAFGAVSWGYGELGQMQALGAQHAFQDLHEIGCLFKTSRARR